MQLRGRLARRERQRNGMDVYRAPRTGAAFRVRPASEGHENERPAE